MSFVTPSAAPLAADNAPGTLTKKQQKALAFRNKSGKKGSKTAAPEPLDIPEQDEPEETPAASTSKWDAPIETSTKSKSKRSKEKKAKQKAEAEGAAAPAASSSKGKEKASDEVEEGQAATDGEAKAESKKSGKKDAKQRFILFVGHLAYRTTATQVADHFEQHTGSKPSVRLLTTKPTPATAYHKANPSKSRGMAFIEFQDTNGLRAALDLHHSTLDGNVINVELTAGGGGAGEQRKKKLQERNERIGTQRKRKAGEDDDEAADDAEDGEADAGEFGQGAKKKQKTRGGRRGKQDDKAADPSLLPGWGARKQGKFATDGQGPPARGGRGGRGGGMGRGGSVGRGGRPKWEPTGANAMTVG